MSMKLFITGTDTHVGKTYISVQLLKAFQQQGFTTLGIKPVAAGCFLKNNRWFSEDALALQLAASLKLDYHVINPFAFEAPASPNIAATFMQKTITVQQLNEQCASALAYPADYCLIEGVGGWFVPLNEKETMADFVMHHQFNIVLVVGIRLGCINHAMLTMHALRQTKLNVIGWFANCVDQGFEYTHDTIMTLRDHLPIPCLGEIPFGGTLNSFGTSFIS